MVTDRGQAYTLEAFTAALLLVGGLLFAFQVTAVTPLTASTSSQHIENQEAQVARGVLDSAVQNESLTDVVLYWNATGGRFFKSNESDGYYATGGPSGTQFGAMLNRTLRDRGLAFNVNVLYVAADGSLKRDRMVYFGAPSDHAVSVRRTVTLYDDDTLTSSSSNTVSETETFYAPDVGPDSGLYNVIRVEVVVWRM